MGPGALTNRTKWPGCASAGPELFTLFPCADGSLSRSPRWPCRSWERLFPGSPAPPQARAWMLVDADTGAVIQSFEDHVPLRPASVEKIVTGLLAVSALPADATVPVGVDAAGEEAAKINMKVGQVWTFQDTLRSLLMVSANDAAVALADRVSGSTVNFARLAAAVARHLGATDNPVLNDPAGLDDSFAAGGGDFISAWDLAVFTRAAMTFPAFRAAVGQPIYDFVGPDGVHHVLRNHNKLLLTDPTLVGVKPGYTREAGDTYVAEAQRGGRSMIVVELGVAPATMYSGAEFLFGQGFATAVAAEPTADRMPPVRLPDVAALAASIQRGGSGAGLTTVAAPSLHARASGTAAAHVGPSSGSGGADLLRVVVLLLAAAAAWLLSRRRRGVPGRRVPARAPAARPGRPGAPVPVRVPARPPARAVGPGDAAWGSPDAAWEAAGAAWEAAVPTQLVDWAEWEIVGAPDGVRAQPDRNRRAASIDR